MLKAHSNLNSHCPLRILLEFSECASIIQKVQSTKCEEQRSHIKACRLHSLYNKISLLVMSSVSAWLNYVVTLILFSDFINNTLSSTLGS